MSKRVRFDRVVAYEFALGLNASAIPLEHGPSIGLVGTPLRVRMSKPKKHAGPRSLHRYDKQHRVRLLQDAGVPMKDIVDFCVEALDIRISRSSCRRKVKRSYQVQRNTEINENANIDYCYSNL